MQPLSCVSASMYGIRHGAQTRLIDTFDDCNIGGLRESWHANCTHGYNSTMLTPERLRAALPVNGLGEPLYFFSTIGSTNDYARELAEQGAPQGTLVVTDEQTAGRGRGDNRWETPARSALAFSVILRPKRLPPERAGIMTALGALAVAEAIEGLGRQAEIKWPNDVLMSGKKVAGVLAEIAWQGDTPAFAVIGVGVNVRPKSVPMKEEISFPATCVELRLGRVIDRHRLLIDILIKLADWYHNLESSKFMETWEAHLAYRGHMVAVEAPSGDIRGKLKGLSSNGRLCLEGDDKAVFEVGPESSRLRPIDKLAR